MQSRILRAILAGVISFIPLIANGHTPLPAEIILTRLTVKLTGQLPQNSDLIRFREDLRNSPQDAEQIIARTIDRLMTSREFFGSIDRFHAIWFRVPVGESSKLAAHVVANDRSYFEIFEKDYLLANANLKSAYLATGASFAGQFPSSQDVWDEVRISAGENRFRSILSNLDILNRYPDTPTNRNRSRANFVFRSFFCETLSPPEKSRKTFHKFDNDDDHANNPDCVGCHYRLDPMARFFDHWRPAIDQGTWFDPDQNALGKVVIPVSGGIPAEHPGLTETALARILAEQPLVQSCIASKAWEFAFGTSLDIPEQFRPELVASFQRRSSLKDAIKLAMTHPYFWSTTTPPPMKYANVAPILNSCGNCHAPEKMLFTTFDPASYPFDQDHGRNVDLLTRIYGSINHRDGFLPMPKAPRPKLPPESLAKIRDWILNGAIDNNGNPTLTSEEMERVLDE